jgi:hypothetical protein
MPTVFAQVADYTDRAGKFGNSGGGDGVGFNAAARLAQSGNVVNIDGKLNHTEQRQKREQKIYKKSPSNWRRSPKDTIFMLEFLRRKTESLRRTLGENPKTKRPILKKDYRADKKKNLHNYN